LEIFLERHAMRLRGASPGACPFFNALIHSFSFILALAVMTILASCHSAGEEAAPFGQPIRVMTFNIRYNNPNDGIHAWPNRKDMVAAIFSFYNVGIAGVQEALYEQVLDLQQLLPDYAWAGVGRTDGKTEGEFSAIFYRKGLFRLLDSGTFWLSETPEVPGSKSWDAAIERIVTWARFLDRRQGKTFAVFNTHFDHHGPKARSESARLLLEKIAEIAPDIPVVLTGDFNTSPGSLPYRILTGAPDSTNATTNMLRLYDSRKISIDKPFGPQRTFTGFDNSGSPDARIDFIFVSKGVLVRQQATLTEDWDGRLPSDHRPVLAEIFLP